MLLPVSRCGGGSGDGDGGDNDDDTDDGVRISSDYV